ncbi:HAMP domain-containing protein [Heliobacillus mobilis]|uniref:HAMP domain-containing protein n=1 Tax=Heliobacterium mobile TaxID=28064 RepID=A0A6I3SPB5_HELMO|nr:methyl-accepting chemotaxis protein [Heliobacterium mobile]MTV50097.1 HAMP domain-containing protein [Heliobacterium mobile]
MQTFRNFNTATKIISLIVLMSVFMLGVGFVGFSYTNVVSSNMQAMYRDSLLPVKWLNQVRADNRLVEELTLKIMLTDQDKNTENVSLSKINEQIQEIISLLNEYETTNLDSFESEKLALIRKKLDAYGVEHQKALNLATNGQKSIAYAEFSQNATPLMMDVNTSLNELAEYKSKKAEEENNNAMIGSAMAKRMIIGITVVAAIVSLGLGLIISKVIANPLVEMVGRIQQVAEGNLSINQVKVNSTDEVGQLGIAINTMLVNMRKLVKQVTVSAETVTSSSEELSASTEQSAHANSQVAMAISDVAHGAAEQVKTINNTARIVDQISASIQQISVNTNEVAAMSDRTDESAQDGERAIHTTVSQMMNIEKTVMTSAGVVARLGDKSKEIDQIVTTISEIAAQTNLLALNAAIEAARAGENGRGFAVVAEEVRKLAEQSQVASKQIAELIREVQEDTQKAVVAMSAGTHEVKIGTDVVNDAGTAFRDIATLITQVSGKIREISSAIQHVASGSQQIAFSVREIAKISDGTANRAQTVSAATQEQSAAMEQIAASSQSLSSMAMELQASLHKFKV